ncbi:MAG TPA: hypothetical protein VG845_00200 [Dehalococcoidia bacterium]|nr:hypothetical protein [Dehalococcoidia bacterium]
MSDDERHNPLDDWVSFPQDVIDSRQEMLPSESHGWGLNLVLRLPRPVAFAYVRSQLTTAGFVDESAGAAAGLFRFIREDAYVWGSVTDAAEGQSRVFLSCNTVGESSRSDA